MEVLPHPAGAWRTVLGCRVDTLVLLSVCCLSHSVTPPAGMNREAAAHHHGRPCQPHTRAQSEAVHCSLLQWATTEPLTGPTSRFFVQNWRPLRSLLAVTMATIY